MSGYTPVIGITTSFQSDEQQLAWVYIQAVAEAGGLPWIVPILEDEYWVQELSDKLDGLVITGGPAISDGLVGQLPEDLSETHPVRREWDKRFVQYFSGTGKPILGICYGMQLLNMLAGGTIYADVQKQLPGAGLHSNRRGADRHLLTIQSDSRLSRELGKTVCEVNTRHIQAIAHIGDGYNAVAFAPDGVVEAIEHVEKPILGVQFHPERAPDDTRTLFMNLVNHARIQAMKRMNLDIL
ncbi:MAG: gamma-glutamyl-gamma-aminobutyrate hydrolase family protein [Bacteroidetes Order II. Incertae sedis bacterium]|nr:gamma-glutamyl-gamma-aminobutyrate hydrolase family protein [Bacteroidetes Order II. bacterium]